MVKDNSSHGVFLDSNPVRVRIIGLTAVGNGGWGLLGGVGADSMLADIQGSGNTSGLDVSTGWQLPTTASVAARAGFTVPHGAAPTSPANGDVWSTTAGQFHRINGVTKTVAYV